MCNEKIAYYTRLPLYYFQNLLGNYKIEVLLLVHDRLAIMREVKENNKTEKYAVAHKCYNSIKTIKLGFKLKCYFCQLKLY